MTTQELNKIKLQRIVDEFGYNHELKKSMKCIFPANHNHGDRKASAGYDERKNKYYCQGCGLNLSPVDFIMKELNCSVSEALEWGESHFGERISVSDINVPFPTSEGKGMDIQEHSLKPNSKVYETILIKGEPFTGDYRGINKELLNGKGIRKGFGNYLNKLPDKPSLIQTLKDCGVVNDFGYYVLKGYDILIPYIVDGRIVNIQGNNPDKTPKYKFLSGIEKPLFNADILKGLKRGDTLWVVEGVFDCLSLIQLGENAVGLAGANSFHKYKPEFEGLKIRTILDNDEAGAKLGKDMMESGLDVTVFKWNREGKYDINDFLMEHNPSTVDDIINPEKGQVESYRAAGENAATGNVERNFLADLDEFWNISHRVKMGETFGYKLNKFPLLEKALDGIQDGKWAIGGGTNIGKTALLLNLSLDLIESNEGLKVIYFQIDGGINAIIGRLLTLLGGVRISETYKMTDNPETEARKKLAWEAIRKLAKENRLDIVDTNKINDIGQLVDYCKLNKADKMMIAIDGANYLGTGKREGLEADKLLSTEIRNLSTALNCPIIFTLEVRKATEIKNASQEKLATREFTIEDIKGSGSLVYQSDVVSTVSLVNESDFENPDESDFQVQILKSKWLGGERGRILMKFDKRRSLITENKKISYDEKKEMKNVGKGKSSKMIKEHDISDILGNTLGDE